MELKLVTQTIGNGYLIIWLNFNSLIIGVNRSLCSSGSTTKQVCSKVVKWETSTWSSNSYLDSIYNEAINAGAISGKVSGAGGGGFMLFFVPPKNRIHVIKALSNFKGLVSNCHFTDNGAQAWRI